MVAVQVENFVLPKPAVGTEGQPSKISKFELEGNQRLILTLAFFTGIVHILLGLKDTLLLVGGIGVIAISSPRLFSQSIHSMYRINLIILGVAISTIFIAYFVSNHSLHYIVEDYLGIVTKLSELGILKFLSFLIVRFWKIYLWFLLVGVLFPFRMQNDLKKELFLVQILAISNVAHKQS